MKKLIEKIRNNSKDILSIVILISGIFLITKYVPDKEQRDIIIIFVIVVIVINFISFLTSEIERWKNAFESKCKECAKKDEIIKKLKDELK